MIHKARVDRGLKQREVANIIGTSVMFVSELESGKKIPEKGKSLERIAEFLGKKYADIVGIAIASKAALKSSQKGNEFDAKMALARKIMNSKNLNQKRVKDILEILEGGD